MQGERSEAKEEGGAQRGDGQMHLLSLDIFGRMEGCLSHFQSCLEQFSRYPFFMALQTTFLTLTPAKQGFNKGQVALLHFQTKVMNGIQDMMFMNGMQRRQL